MKKSAMLLALSGLGLAVVPAHANVRNTIFFGPSFSTTLSNISDGSLAYITGIGPQGTFNFGQLSFDGVNNQFDLLNATGIDPNPDTNFVVDPTYNILDEVDFTNLSLTETLSSGQTQIASLYTDPLGADPATTSNFSDTGLFMALYSAPLTPGTTVKSVTLTGLFSDGNDAPGTLQTTEVAAVPEASPLGLLALGLLPVGLILSARVRAGRRTL